MKRSFVVAMAVIAGLVTVSPALFAQAEIARFSGNGMRNTQPFTAPDSWELHWDARGAIFQVYLYSASGEMLDVLANQDKPGEGSSYVAKGGSYYLEVNALGSWTVSVVKSTGGPSTSKTVDFSGTGARTTKPFTMKGPWTIGWDATGEILQIYLYSGSGDLVDVAANQMQPGKGSSYVPRGGTYYLQVNALGSWAIRVSERR